jgi:Asp-tRNA(Asn)/Glu-tRNA(Gln) amidotransferase A subunit family amidase
MRLQRALAAGDLTPTAVAADTIARANGNASRNTYLYFDPQPLMEQAQTLESIPPAERGPLYGVPISLKDCFDLAGTVTTCGSRFYAEQAAAPADSGPTTDSGMARRLRQTGALITGKTHLHPLAYGITGQNPEYGDCLQPRDATLLTGGSSSGAAASVQEASALAAIGTDTGGSVRVPAALCGLVGYRASHRLAAPQGQFPDAWTGAAHLAPSFDTVGFLLRDVRDAAPIAQALFGLPLQLAPLGLRIGVVPAAFLEDCEPEVLAGFDAWQQRLTAMGAQVEVFDTEPWAGTMDIFAGIQAHEAAAIHRGHFEHFEASIRDRLVWGDSLSPETLDRLRARLAVFRAGLLRLFSSFDLLMLPAAPVSRLPAGADHAGARSRILRYTTPFSMGGLPAVSLPGEMIGSASGTGVQIAAAPNEDALLLAFASSIGAEGSGC